MYLRKIRIDDLSQNIRKLFLRPLFLGLSSVNIHKFFAFIVSSKCIIVPKYASLF